MYDKNGRGTPGDTNTWFSAYKTTKDQYHQRNDLGAADFIGLFIAGAIIVGLLWFAGVR